MHGMRLVCIFFGHRDLTPIEDEDIMKSVAETKKCVGVQIIRDGQNARFVNFGLFRMIAAHVLACQSCDRAIID